jgi:hypothetical protein
MQERENKRMMETFDIEEHHNLYSLPIVIRVIKSRRTSTI